MHGGTPFDINLPGVECRTGGANKDYEIIASFLSDVSYNGATVTSGTGSVVFSTVSAPATISIFLTGVTSGQTITVTLAGVSDGENSGDVLLPISILVGDSNGDRFVNSGDAQQTRNRSGQLTDAINFRSDYNLDGTINSGDAFITRSRSGNFIP